jgi:hypothetical protein
MINELLFMVRDGIYRQPGLILVSYSAEQTPPVLC